MEASQLRTLHLFTPGHACGRCVERPLVGNALGPGEVSQVSGQSEALFFGKCSDLSLDLLQRHARNEVCGAREVKAPNRRLGAVTAAPACTQNDKQSGYKIPPTKSGPAGDRTCY